MKSDIPKVLSKVLFEPMLGWVIDAAHGCGMEDICVVTGFKNEMVIDYLNSLKIKCKHVVQEKRMGTAHAVISAMPFLKEHSGGNILVLGGDSPFINTQTIKMAYKEHKKSNNSATVIASVVENPFGYGRIIRDPVTLQVVSIVEQRDAAPHEKQISEINSGAYWFNINDLIPILSLVTENTSQKEYYLTSVIKLLIDKGLRVNAFKEPSPNIVLGANDPVQLQKLNQIARDNIINNMVESGVDIPYHDGIIIGKSVKIHEGTTILPGTIILGNTVIGKRCIIGPNSHIIDCTINDECEINYCYCENSNIYEGKKLGPFEYFINKNDEFLRMI